ncbi:glycerol-3-phosphate responsive antiterminator [Bacillus gobiensis]|uniref:glycerol-3-phosphate responsive antiterminator n=1 Tax=Bacillus gobiensis TaxID=1441095 RepID=UPI003D21ED37
MLRCKEENVFFERLFQHKKIAAVKHPKSIEKAIMLKDQISAVFLLTGNIMSVKKYVDLLKNEGIPVFVHIEKIGGISMDNEGLDFVANYVRPLGIVSTKPNLIAKARKRKLMTIQRIFMIDTEVYDHALHIVEQHQPDLIEIMPSRLPQVIRELSQKVHVPLITGGLLSEKAHAVEALENGAVGVSTSNIDVWKADLSMKEDVQKVTS